MAKATSLARPRRNKSDVQHAFAQVRDEVDAARDAKSVKADETAKLVQAEIRQAVEGLSVETAAQSVSALTVQISKALADVSEHLIAEVQRLAQARAAVALEREELERLHKIDVSVTSLDDLVQDYDVKRQTLEAEMSTQRSAWEVEADARGRAEKEQEDTLRKQRQRESEEYEYKKALERRKAQEKHDEDVRTLDKKNRERQEALEKSWQEREAALALREEEDARLRQDIAGFAARLQADTERARTEAIQQTEQRFEHQMLLITKERDADRRVAELQIKTLEANVTRQTAELAALQKQLDEAKQQVQDIAVKAIEGASGARALAHVNQIAMEQAKTRAGQA